MRFQAHAARVHAFKPWWKCEKRVCAMVHRTCKFNPCACAGSLRHSPLISLALTAQESGKLRVSTLAWKEVELDTHRKATTRCTYATECVYRCETERGPAVTPAGTACAAQMWKLIFVENHCAVAFRGLQEQARKCSHLLSWMTTNVSNTVQS